MDKELKIKAKRTANELVSRFMDYTPADESLEVPFAIKAALVAVEYLIMEQDMWQNGQSEPVKYWQEVKKQLECYGD